MNRVTRPVGVDQQSLAPFLLKVGRDLLEQIVITRLEAPFDLDPGSKIRQIEIHQVAPFTKPLGLINPANATCLKLSRKSNFQLGAKLHAFEHAGNRAWPAP